MLEGSFRPPSSATALHHSYSIAKNAYTDQASAPVLNMRRKENGGGPTFTPIHDRPVSSSHSPEYDSEDLQQSASPSSHSPRYLKNIIQSTHSSSSLATVSPSHMTSLHASTTESQSPLVLKVDPKLPHESIPKNSSIGPVRAKKKPAGSACNSCHRLKTRCSGGHPCDRCAAHKVPCQFDRDLIYRSPLASSSQQASARNAHTMSKADSSSGPKSRSRASGKAGRKAATAAAAASVAATAVPSPAPPPVSSQSLPPPPLLPMTLSQPAQLSPPPVPTLPALSASITAPQNSSLSVSSCKPVPKPNHVSTPAPSEAFVGYEANPAQPSGLHIRLAALENSVSGLLQVLRAHQPSSTNLIASTSEHRPPPSPPPPPALMVSSSSSSFGPDKDQPGDTHRLGSSNTTCAIGDPFSEGILPATQLQYLYDVFIEFCLPSLPILHAVQIALVRSRSSFLFAVMVTIGARFCSSQSVTHIPPGHTLMSTSTGARIDLSQVMIDEPTYNRLVALCHRHLSATLLKATHTLEDVRAILFLACWALVSNEDPNGAPNRWVLIGHAGRIARSIGLDRCASELRGCNGIWDNSELHEARREQLDAIKTDEALRAIETILSSNLRLEPSRDFFPPLHMPGERQASCSLVKLATGSPSQYDVVSAAQIEALAELTEIWAAANSFLSVADDRNRALSGEQLIELGERHNQVMDAWAKKWTWHGSSWAPLLGANLRIIKLLSESLRITLNLAFTNVLYAIGALSRPPPPKFHEALAVALERVNGSSTAVIQAHRDSVREGFSLAFAPDLVTDGLVSAAITVLQLASPIAFAPILGKSGCKEINKSAFHNSGASSNTEVFADEDRLLTPNSTEDKIDADMGEVKVPISNGTSHSYPNHLIKGPPHESRASSTCSTPRRRSKSGSPRMANNSFFNDVGGGSNPAIGKKCFMEPPVAAHYIRMATDVLQASDRSQTRLGTIMAGKIMKLATQAGLMGNQSVANLNTRSVSNSSSAAISREGRPSISSTSSLSSTKPARIPSADNLERISYSSKPNGHTIHGNRPSSADGLHNAPAQVAQIRPVINREGSLNGVVSGTFQEPSLRRSVVMRDSHVQVDGPEDEDEAEEEEEEDDIEEDGYDDGMEHVGGNFNIDYQSVEDAAEKKLPDMMEEDS